MGLVRPGRCCRQHGSRNGLLLGSAPPTAGCAVPLVLQPTGPTPCRLSSLEVLVLVLMLVPVPEKRLHQISRFLFLHQLLFANCQIVNSRTPGPFNCSAPLKLLLPTLTTFRPWDKLDRGADSRHRLSSFVPLPKPCRGTVLSSDPSPSWYPWVQGLGAWCQSFTSEKCYGIHASASPGPNAVCERWPRSFFSSLSCC
jgi:hypothetical protein